MMPEGVEGIHRILVVQSYLRNEERIVGKVVFRQPRLDALVVDVNAKHVDGRCSAMPEIYEMSQRTA